MPRVTTVPLAPSGIGLPLSFLRCCLRRAESIQGRRRASGLLSLPGASPFWLQTPASQGAKYRTRFVLVRASSVALVVLPLSVLCSNFCCLGLLSYFSGISSWWSPCFSLFCVLVSIAFGLSSSFSILGISSSWWSPCFIVAFARAPAFRRVGLWRASALLHARGGACDLAGRGSFLFIRLWQ